MVTALRYLMSNPWAASRIQSARWRDTDWMGQQDIDGWTAALCDVHPLGTDGDLEEALAYAPAVSTFDYVIPERQWVPGELKLVPERVPGDEEPTPESNQFQKIYGRMWKGEEGYLSKGARATVIDPDSIVWSWRVTALRGWEVATNWEAQYRLHHHHARSTARQLQVFEDLVAGYARAFLVGLDAALDDLVLCTRNSPDWQAANIELLRGDINNPPNTTAGTGPGVVVPG